MYIHRGNNHAIHADGELEINSIIRDRRYEEDSNECLKYGGPASEVDGNEVERIDVLTTVKNIYHRHDI